MAEVPDSIFTEVTFYCWTICFHVMVLKPLMLILPLLPILCVFEKLDYQGRQTHKIPEFQGGHIFG